MIRPTEVEQVDVWREGEHAATITRTPRGSRFEYAEAFFSRHRDLPGGIAIHLPYRIGRVETSGANLHTYFAGLLPEGLRLRVLLSRLKSSADDLLSLLVAAGTDTVGDLVVVPQGQRPPPAPRPQRGWKASELLFPELLAESLAAMGGEEAEPVVPGVQEKVSASTISFPLRSGPGAFILKLNPEDKPQLVENETFFMRLAKASGLRVARTQLVHDREGNAGLLVERFDRRWAKEEKRMVRIHQEDACQFLDRYPADKYRIACSAIAEGLLEHCAAPLPELGRFLRLLAFSYLIANGDLHAKNVSLLADGPHGSLRLSPAYDLLSTLPYGDRRMALPFEGRDDNFRRSHFVAFGKRFGLREGAVARILDDVCAGISSGLDGLEEIGLGERRTEDLRRTMQRRLDELSA